LSAQVVKAGKLVDPEGATVLPGRRHSLGSIKPGRYANLIAVRGDPLADVFLLERVDFGMKEGKVYKQG
jgi:imidazolonepropionase-like amidohydrolase